MLQTTNWRHVLSLATSIPFPHQVIAYGNGLDVHSTRQVQPWRLGPASFAGTPTARIGLGRASASADNNPTGKLS